MHIRRQSHKDKECALKSQQQNESSKQLVQATSVNSTNTDGMNVDPKPNGIVVSTNSTAVDHNGSSSSRSKSSSIDIAPKRISTMKLVDVINVNQFPQTIVATAIDLTSRTHQRIFHEKQIVKLLMGELRKFDTTLRMLPFGSATYGYGGTDTNFNILVNAGNRNLHIRFSQRFSMHDFRLM